MVYRECLFQEGSEVVALDDIYPSAYVAHPDFYNEVEEEIREGGLAFPLVVVHSTVKHWREVVTASPALMPVPEHLSDKDMVYWAACGNNRLRILKNFGWSKVDCIVVPEFKQANDYCFKQRKWQNDRHGRRTRG